MPGDFLPVGNNVSPAAEKVKVLTQDSPALTTADRLRVAATCGTHVTISAESARSIANMLDLRSLHIQLLEQVRKRNDGLLMAMPAFFVVGILLGAFIGLRIAGVLL